MPALPYRSIRSAAVLWLGSAASALAATAAAPAAIVAAPPSGIAPPAIRLAAMADVPTVPHRRGGGRRSKEKDKPYQPLAKDPVGESAAAHKDYLKRYGF